MRTGMRTVVAIALLWPGIVCGQSQVTGRIFDITGTVVSGAAVTLGTANTKTDDRGRYTVSNVPPGNWELRIVAPGFKQLTKKTTVIAAVDLNLEDITLQVVGLRCSVEVVGQNIRITGRVVDRSGFPATGVTMELRTYYMGIMGPGMPGVATSSWDGGFTLPAYYGGEQWAYEIHFSAPGYRDRTVSVGTRPWRDTDMGVILLSRESPRR